MSLGRGTAVAAVVCAAALAGCGGPARAEVALVRASDAGFDPPSITVPVGTEVRWVNDGPFLLSVTPVEADDGIPAWGTDRLRPGETFAAVFDSAGSYAYASTVDADRGPLVGVVQVQVP